MQVEQLSMLINILNEYVLHAFMKYEKNEQSVIGYL